VGREGVRLVLRLLLVWREEGTWCPALPGREKVAETVKKGKKKEEDPLTKDESVQAGQRNQTLREGKV
jgi:hypothetical protein